MVQFILAVLILFSFDTRAQLFGFGEDNSGFKSRLPELIEKLKSIELKVDPFYEEGFNQAVKNIENGMEEEKLYCVGEAVDGEGKAIPKEKKQLCMRELKKQYLEAMMVVFNLKKKYLELIHARQFERLEEVHSKLKNHIEKNF